MASIEKRGEYWRARVRITGHPEKTQRFTSKAAASRWAKQIETELNESEYVDTSDYVSGIALMEPPRIASNGSTLAP
jgi:hypothetical protein